MTLGIGLATKTFERSFNFSKAQTLGSTLNYLISDELRTARSADDTGENFVYHSENYVGKYAGKNGDNSCVEITVNDEGRILVETDDSEDAYNNGSVYVLGSSKLYGENLQVEDFEIGLSEDRKNFTVHYAIIDKKYPNTPLYTSDFQIRSIEG